MRLRASSTVTAKPESCSRRAATKPAMPAPTTTTRSALAVPMDHEPVMRSTSAGQLLHVVEQLAAGLLAERPRLA